MTKRLSDNIPQQGLELVNYKGKQVIEKLGVEIIKEVVYSVLTGENIRALTEGLTRHRLALSNAAMIVFFLRTAQDASHTISELPEVVRRELLASNPLEKKRFLGWIIGLTGKSIQNVLRSNREDLNHYIKEYKDKILEISELCENTYGKLSGSLKLDAEFNEIDWKYLLFLCSAIGTQTLAIRGSEKSMYGKLFERLILGSLLSILGFKYSKDYPEKASNIFWLSDRGKKRESDATIIYKPGIGFRFDMGFIGPGNPEISLEATSKNAVARPCGSAQVHVNRALPYGRATAKTNF